MLLGENTKMPCITIMAIDTDVVARTVARKYEGQPDADVRALEYLGKIMQLSVGLPEPREAELERLVLEAGMPSKAGGRPDRAPPPSNAGPQDAGAGQPSAEPGERPPHAMVGITEAFTVFSLSVVLVVGRGHASLLANSDTRRSKRVVWRLCGGIKVGLDHQVTIMDGDPLLGFETSERDALKGAKRFLATNPRKIKRARPHETFSTTIHTPYSSTKG